MRCRHLYIENPWNWSHQIVPEVGTSHTCKQSDANKANAKVNDSVRKFILNEYAKGKKPTTIVSKLRKLKDITQPTKLQVQHIISYKPKLSNERSDTLDPSVDRLYWSGESEDNTDFVSTVNSWDKSEMNTSSQLITIPNDQSSENYASLSDDELSSEFSWAGRSSSCSSEWT